MDSAKYIEFDVENKELETSEHRLDQLAWLIEGSSMCTAVSVMNQEFCIAANEFFCGTQGRERNQQLDYICAVMEYFRDVANQVFPNDQEKTNRQNDLMQLICKHQINTATFGRVKVSDIILRNVMSAEVLSQEELPDSLVNAEEQKYLDQHKDLAYLTLGFGLLIFKRLKKIEYAIEKANKGDFAKIKNDQLMAFKNFYYDNKVSSNILFFEQETGVHAELQILSQIIDRIQKELPVPKTIYIGISKRCCVDCHCMLDISNKMLELNGYGISVKFAGAHDASFASNWIKPSMFIQGISSTFGRTRSRTKETDVSQLSLQNQIGREYIREIESRVANESYEQRHSPSDSDISVTLEEKVSAYQDELKQNLSVLTKLGLQASREAKMLSVGLELCGLKLFTGLFDIEPGEINSQQRFDLILFNFNDNRAEPISEKFLMEILTNPNFSGEYICSHFKGLDISGFGITDDISINMSEMPQIQMDHLLAWRLQIEEYKQGKQLQFRTQIPILYQFTDSSEAQNISFTLRSASSGKNGRDCFFESINKPSIINRDILVKKLLGNAGTKEIRQVFGHEILQFLYLGFAGAYVGDFQENQACHYLLNLNNGAIRELFLELQGAEENLRRKVEQARSELGVAETKDKKPHELATLLSERHSELEMEFNIAYADLLKTDKMIYDYCAQEEIFKNYVELYLRQAEGYIPFSRDFSGVTVDTTIDIINQLFELNIKVYLPKTRGSAQLIQVNQHVIADREPTYIIHNGINHFNGLDLAKLKIEESPMQESPSKHHSLQPVEQIDEQVHESHKRKSTDDGQEKNISHEQDERDPKRYKSQGQHRP